MSVPSADQPRVVIKGSDRRPLAGAERGDRVDAAEQITVTVVLRRPGAAPEPSTNAVSREEFRQRHGAAPNDIAQVESFAQRYELRTHEVNVEARTLKLTGAAKDMENAFGVVLHRYSHPTGSYRGREGSISLPQDLGDIVVGVFGLDDRPQVRPHIKLGDKSAAGATSESAGSFTAPEVASLYKFPTAADGTGQCVAIVEFGGGYLDTDLSSYFDGLGISHPTVVSVGVDGADNSPGSSDRPQDADGEVALDIQVVGAVAPGARIAVYFAPNSDAGFIDAITTAVHDRTNNPSVISISWGGPENTWTPQTTSAVDSAFLDAGALGITVFAAAGDHGSADVPPFVTDPFIGAKVANPDYDGHAHADFPASSPNAVGCGGTHLEASDGTISSETVWNDEDGWATGGGVSDMFDVPVWQQSAGVPASVNPGGHVGRGVPDVSGNADSVTGYQITLYGETIVVGGTSAVAPLWSGLFALLNESAGKGLGAVNARLYAGAAGGAFFDVESGTNAIPAVGTQPATPGYPADAGWDACTGLGSPNGTALLTLLTGTAPGG